MLFYGLSLGPPWVEGLRNSVREVGKRLAARGHEVTVVTKGRFGRLTLDGITYVGLPAGSEAYSSGAGSAIARLTLWAASRSSGFDAVNGHASFPLLALPSMAASAAALRVFTLYSPLSQGQAETDLGPAENTLFRLSKSALLARLTGLRVRYVCISERIRQSLPGGVRERACTIPVGVDYRRFASGASRNEAASDLGLDEGFRILFAGDVTPWKGGEDFLMMAKMVLEDHPDCLFLFLTKDTYERERQRRQKLEGLASSLGVAGRTRFLGRQKDMSAVYAASDVVVLPYRSMYTMMSTPLSLLEAMAAGRPVVATSVGDMQEVVRHEQTGLLARPKDPSSLSGCVLRLYQDSGLRERLGRAAQEEAKNRDWANIATLYERFYENTD